jgi:ferrous iron transport protein A
MTDREFLAPAGPLMQPLAAFAPGEGAIIGAFAGGRKLQERLVALGLFPGQRLTICQNNGSSLVVRLNGNRIALGRGISQKILATPSLHNCQRHNDCQCALKDGENKD